MQASSYLTVAGDGRAETEVEGSRFVARVARVSDEADARGVVEQVRRQAWDAEQHGHALVLGAEGRRTQSADGGEPGTLILEAVRAAGLSDVVAVVSRWAGSIPLPPAAVARAYAAVVGGAVEQVGVVERVRHDLCEVTVDFTQVGRLEHGLRARGAVVLGVDYPGDASLRFAVPPAARAVIEEILDDLTDGAARPRVIGEQWVDAPR